MSVLGVTFFLGAVSIRLKGTLRMAISSTDTNQGAYPLADRDAEQTFEAAFDANWSWVCGVLYRILWDWDDAQDLALEVFYRLHERPPRDPERIRSWLYRVASNMGLNALRARQRRRRYEQDAGTYALQHAPTRDPADQAERSEAREHVREVLAHMRPRAAQVLVLRHSGLSYAEIAATMNVAVGSVGTLLARAEKAFERHYRALEETNETL